MSGEHLTGAAPVSAGFSAAVGPARAADSTGAAPSHRLHAAGRILQIGGRPLLMGVVNASPDSFSDGGRYTTHEQRIELAAELLDAGADILDVGGESASTDRPAVGVAEEVERVAPLIERLVGELGATVSVDTYKPPVASAAIAAGASIVNDVSGLCDPELAQVCAQTGAALVLMHTRAAPKQRLQDPDLYVDVVEEVLAFLRERIATALEHGMAAEQLIVDPGPDFAKTPAQTVELLVALPRLHELGRPVLMAISRKDFIGALTGRAPRTRLAGTLAALAHGLDAGAHIFRVHDVVAAADFIAVRSALRGERTVERELVLADELRHDRPGS
ncbi:MAG TPA: dihydropteroate synthase [Solirubrobacteraceae bacterium]|jgi:dihydropteroate synthase|nr:dihydropteroate synthase [Solirubrobacteraceae bacterium]